MENPTYYYLNDYADEVCPYSPTLDAIRDWLSKPDEAWNRDMAAEPGDEFGATSLEIVGWRRVYRTENGWKIDGELPTTDFLAVVDGDGVQHWYAEDILYGENIDEMMDYQLGYGSSGEDAEEAWLVCGKNNEKPLIVTYNGPSDDLSIREDAAQ